MISNYVFYLHILSNEQKIKELLIVFIIFIVFFGICVSSDILKLKFKNIKKMYLKTH